MRNGKHKTKEEFVSQAVEVHGDVYDYTDFVYINNKAKGIIHCRKCGRNFEKSPVNHIFQRQGCPYCSPKRTKPYTTEEAIEKAKSVHGEKYDYSRFVYVKDNVKSCIICPIHGEFWQTPNKHIVMRQGCPKCASNAEVSFEVFLERAKAKFGNSVEYDEKDYHGYNKPFMAFCHKHGWFELTPIAHASQKYGCPKCAAVERGMNSRISFEEFVARAREKHGDKYTYDEKTYTLHTEKMRIICPTHGEFWQTPFKHAYNGEGCPICSESRLEREVRQFLDELGVEYITQASKNELSFLERLRLDFYLPKLNVAIECQGIQHFCETSFFEHGKVRERDERKYSLCTENGVEMLYFAKNAKWFDKLPFYKDKNNYSSLEELRKKLKEHETGD